MKLTKELLACIETGSKEEISGVGYLFTAGNGLSVITCYNTKLGIFSFNNTKLSVEIKPYDRDDFPAIIGKGGERLVRLKHQSGASDIRMLELSLAENFSHIQSTSYKSSVKEGGKYHQKKLIKVYHFDDTSGCSFENCVNQMTSFVLVVAEASTSFAEETHKLIRHAITIAKDRRLEELQKQKAQQEEEERKARKADMLHQARISVDAVEKSPANQRARLLTGRAKFRVWSSANNQSEAYQHMCDDLLDQKYVHHNKGKKYSKNLKVCIQNNNSSSRSCSGKTSKRDLARLSKQRATQLSQHDVTKLRKKSRNWKCAPISQQSLLMVMGDAYAH